MSDGTGWSGWGFGLIWGIDATLKWLPGFRDQYLAMIKNSGQGQPPWLMPWFHFWASLIGTAPGLFAVLTAVTETVICLSLLLGVLQRAGFGLGIVFGLLIWGIGEGFGGPYMSGATDIGCAIIYSVAFVALLAVPTSIRASAPSADARIAARWPALAPLTFRSPAARRTPAAAPETSTAGPAHPISPRRPGRQGRYEP